jgi:hypothetical protein
MIWFRAIIFRVFEVNFLRKLRRRQPPNKFRSFLLFAQRRHFRGIQFSDPKTFISHWANLEKRRIIVVIANLFRAHSTELKLQMIDLG